MCHAAMVFSFFIFVTIIKIKIYSKRRQAFDNKKKKKKSMWFAWLSGAHKTLIAKTNIGADATQRRRTLTPGSLVPNLPLKEV